MEVANVTQGTILTSGGTTYVADKLTTNILGINLTQRQMITGIGCFLLGFILSN